MESSHPHDFIDVRLDACRRHSPFVEPQEVAFLPVFWGNDWGESQSHAEKSCDLGLRYFDLYSYQYE